MERSFTVTVYDMVRKTAFERVFGSATVPVLSPLPQLAELPGFDEPQLVYELDFERVGGHQRVRLAKYLVEKFGLEQSVVESG